MNYLIFLKSTTLMTTTAAAMTRLTLPLDILDGAIATVAAAPTLRRPVASPEAPVSAATEVAPVAAADPLAPP